jgi:hypothetical protein
MASSNRQRTRGCPTPQQLDKKCRAQVLLWSDSRWIFNTQHSILRHWKAGELLRLANDRKVHAIFLNEQGPNFSISFSWSE